MNEAHGILNVIKPLEWTSMDVVRRLKRLTNQKKVGHAGTLDPQASGILPICFGQATRLMEHLISSPKSYEATIRLGISTDSYDASGRTTGSADPSYVTYHDVEQQLDKYRGVFDQIPPMFSALKINGRRLYKLARAGKQVNRPPRKVQIHKLVITEWATPCIKLSIQCGRGMYVRSVAHDLGEDLGCGAHLKELTRVQTGPFEMSSAISMDQLEQALQDNSWRTLLFPVDFPLLNLKAVIVKHERENAIKRGQDIYLGHPQTEDCTSEDYRLYSINGDFLALIHPGKTRGLWKGNKVFNLSPALTNGAE